MRLPVEPTPGPPLPPGSEDMMAWASWVIIAMVCCALVAVFAKMAADHNTGRESLFLMYLEGLFTRPTKEQKSLAAKQELADNFTNLRLNITPDDWPWLDEQAELVGLRITPKRKYEVAA